VDDLLVEAARVPDVPDANESMWVSPGTTSIRRRMGSAQELDQVAVGVCTAFGLP
jgi:hypothetical protein